VALTLLLTTLTTALIVNTWLDPNGFFVLIHARMHAWIDKARGTNHSEIWRDMPAVNVWRTALLLPWPDRLRWIFAKGALCRYCVTHWIGAAVSLAIAPDWWTRFALIAPTIWLANHSISLYSLLSDHLTAVRTRTEIDKAQLYLLMHQQQKPRNTAA
jgi:hypothetical protein